jgi:hypothetical protein
MVCALIVWSLGAARSKNYKTTKTCYKFKMLIKMYSTYRSTLSFLSTAFAPSLEVSSLWKNSSDCHFKCFWCRTLDKTIASLETELSAARTLQESLLNGSPVAEEFKVSESIVKRKYRMVIGINTAFSSRKRRDSIRYTWMPRGCWHELSYG